ncbi:MAG: YHYH protein [Verrucomicrobiota bacterium]
MKSLLYSFLLFSICSFGIPLLIAAVSPDLSPYGATYPGEKTFENPGGPIPPTVNAFSAFKDRLGLSWDDDFLYIESNGIPDHDMMRGIVAWQQQVPLPHPYVGANRFALPLNPTVLEEPQKLTLMGPIAIAVNGIPIFHALTQSGKDAYLGGELDEWGGHCGRADDYHYHIAPAHLEPLVGEGNPVAFGLDGHPVFLADPSRDKPLDECHGYFDEEGKYRYVGDLTNPYMMAFFRGAADLENRPRANGVRPHLQPLRGATITGFSGTLTEGYSLEYHLKGDKHTINYLVTELGAEFEFVDANGSSTSESYERRLDQGGKGDQGKGKSPSGKKAKSKDKGKRGKKDRDPADGF